MLYRSFLLIVFTCFSLNSAAESAEEPLSVILERLKNGGYVVYFRHAATTWMGIDKIEWPRERQRLLSEKGIADARRIGAAFKEMDIPVGEVYASPFARCRDMAEIAFGRVEERMELLGLLSDEDGKSQRVDYLKQKLSMPVVEGNRIIISHTSNIREVADISLGEGDGVVIKPDGNGKFGVLGIINVSVW